MNLFRQSLSLVMYKFTGIGEKTMIMKIGDIKVNVDWENNQAVDALRNMAEKGVSLDESYRTKNMAD